jgi:N-acetylglucosamine-6-sulfatase
MVRSGSLVLVIAGVVSGLVVFPAGVARPEQQASEPERPNIVVILTDDQVLGTIQYMPNVESLLVERGTRFTHAFVNNPLCCPSRSTLMTGQTSGHNGVWWNADGPVGGGYAAFKPHGNQTIFAWLHDAGYRTGFIGKFLNGYRINTGDYQWVLPGVDQWDVFMLDGTNEPATGCDEMGYFSTCYSHNGTLEKHGPTEYSTTTSGQKAVDFIRGAPPEQPLFLYYAPRAPHLPTTPDAPYTEACPFVPQRRLPSFDQNIVNGPSFMQLPPLDSSRIEWFDAKWIAQCQTLLSVDEQVGRIVQELQDTGRLDNTLIMFSTDNGYILGDHRWRGKVVPYEGSDRVPLAIRWDALESDVNARDGHLLTNMDYTATLLDAAGVTPPEGYVFDGQSLLPLIGGPGRWQTEHAVLLEHSGGAEVPPYCGVRTLDWLFTHYATGEEELYDAHADHYQVTNVVAENPEIADALRDETQALCQPLPPGFSWESPARARPS